MAKSKNESINISIFMALKVSEKSKVPVLIMSNPGLGKSTTVSMFAEVRGYKLQLLRGNSTTAEEVLGYDVADQSEDSKTTRHLRPSWFNNVLENEKKGQPTLLFLDEITTANEFVQAALLHLIFERMVGDEKLPESTLIVSAGNYAQNLSNQMNLLPPLMNRFLIYNITPTIDDLDTFLNKYKGSIASKDGSSENYLATLMEQMKELDSQEMKVDNAMKNKIGEYIERGVYDTTRYLMKSSKVDLAVRELQGIYTDIDEKLGNKLYGFITLRTLNYLRDVTIATYLCFGKAGLDSANYRNMIDGLCGIGVKPKKSGGKSSSSLDVEVELVGKEYFDTINSVANDIEKLNNTRLAEYENFFNTIVVDTKIFDIPKMNAIINKVAELKADKGLDTIDRPIDPDTIEKLCNIIKSTASSLGKMKISGVSATTKLTDTIPVETFVGNVTLWNTITRLLCSINSLVKSENVGYKDDTKNFVDKTMEDLKNGGNRLRAVKKLLIKEDVSLGEMIPAIEDLK